MKWNHESTFCRGCDCCEPFVYDSILFEIAHKAILVGNDEPLNDGSVSIGQSHNNDSTNKSGQPVDDHTCRRLPVICPFQAPAGRLHLIPCVTWVTVVDMGVDHILLQIDLSRHLSPSQKPVPGFYIRGETPFDTPVTAGYGSSPLSSEESYTLG